MEKGSKKNFCDYFALLFHHHPFSSIIVIMINLIIVLKAKPTPD